MFSIGNRQFHPTEIRSTDNHDGIAVDDNRDEPQNIRSIYVEGGEIPRETTPERRSHSTNGSFFAIFYERPVRHRYYRQFNRSASNLVRRLSQSRLFLNSSAANRNNIRRNRQESLNLNIEPEPESDSNQIEHIDIDENINANETDFVRSIRASVHSLNMASDNENHTENRLNAIRPVASESDVFGSCERSETPPPPYNTVAQLPHN